MTTTGAITTLDPIQLDAMLVGSIPQGMSLHLEVLGEPTAQPRPRFRVLNGRPLIYDPSQASKRRFKAALRQALSELGVATLPLFPGNGRKFIANFWFYINNEMKDNDNLQKYILDVLQGVVYSNDRFVFDILSKKRIVPKGSEMTKIEIKELVGLEEYH
jgi:Holliday junction resolvase RusA-like endonuclease